MSRGCVYYDAVTAVYWEKYKMKNLKSSVAGALTAMLAALVWSGPGAAYPDKPISYVIPFGPGGESDITARHQQVTFKDMFKQDLVISYKPGGGGAVGWAQLNSLKGDGYTWMGINLPHTILQPLQKDVGYKTDDLVTLIYFHYTPDAVIVKVDSPIKTLKDLIDQAKKSPGKVTFSGSGKGSSNHLAQVRFDKMAGIKTTYVAAKGTGESNQFLLGGQVSGSWGYTSVGAQLGNQVRMLAVAMEQRHPRFPDVPTFREFGFDLISGAYRGIAVPSSTPEPLRKQMSDMMIKVNKDPAFRKKLENDGMAVIDVGYAEMPAFMKKMKETLIPAAREAGVIK